MHWIGAQFCVGMFLDSRDKSLNMFQNMSVIHLPNFRGFRVQAFVTAYNFCRHNKFVADSATSGCSWLLRIPQK